MAGGDEVYEFIPFCEGSRGGRIRFHVCADDSGATEGCANVKGMPALVKVVGWLAYSSVKPSLVEECDNSPAFSLVAAV